VGQFLAQQKEGWVGGDGGKCQLAYMSVGRLISLGRHKEALKSATCNHKGTGPSLKSMLWMPD